MAKLIAIDGLDGSGKETQSKRLAKHLTEKGKKVRLLSFPTYDGKGSTFVDMYLKGELGKNPEDTNAYAASVFFTMDRYYSFKNKATSWYSLRKKMFAERKTHRYFKCKTCKTVLRVPKRNNKIEVTCPKCRQKTIK